MKKLIIGATGAIGSSLAKQIVADGEEVHLVGRDKISLSKIASELKSTFTSCGVLEEDFAEKVFNDLSFFFCYKLNFTSYRLLNS